MKIFETFKCSRQNSSNSSCQFWKWQVNSSSNFASFFIVMTITPLWISSLYFFYFGLKDPIKVPILRPSSALVKICHIHYHKSVFLHILHHPSVSWKITPLYFREAVESPKSWNSIGYFCLKTAYLQLRHIQKIYLTLLSTTCVKIHQIPYVIFETISHFSRYNSSVLL